MTLTLVFVLGVAVGIGVCYLALVSLAIWLADADDIRCREDR